MIASVDRPVILPVFEVLDADIGASATQLHPRAVKRAFAQVFPESARFVSAGLRWSTRTYILYMQ